MRLHLQAGNIYLVIELLIAELIFLYPAPKRPGFQIRLPLAFLSAVLLSGFLPWLQIPGLLVIPYVLRAISVFAISVVSMGFVFSLPMRNLLSLCSAGYAVQHIAFRVSLLAARTAFLSTFSVFGIDRDRLLELIAVVLIYILVFLTYGRYTAKNECFRNSDARLDKVSILIVIICMILSRFPRVFGEDANSITNSIYAILCCYLALFIQFNIHQMALLSREKLLLDRLRQEEKKQYEISKNVIDSINIKVHDAKHKLTANDGKLPPEEAESLMQDIRIYDSTVKTGNPALDVLLTEKSNKCQVKGISLTCSGDGSVLSFMRTMDIYSLFGNAVDNAIEAVDSLEEEKKYIDIAIEKRGDLVFLSFSNYFNGTLAPLAEGLPQTTKTDEIGYHGFGMKSMKQIAGRYDGDLSVTTRGEIFYLNIYLQIPKSADK